MMRVASAIFFLPPILIAVWAGSLWFVLAVTIVALLGLLEFYRLIGSTGLRPAWALGMAWTAALIGTAAAFGPPAVLATIVIGALAILIWVMARRQVPGALTNWAFSIAGPLYLGGSLLHAVLLRQVPNDGLAWVLVTLAGTFATDTAAYFTGRALGRHKMAPKISPSKTWEGALGGFICAIAVTTLVAWPFDLPVPIWQMALLGAAIGIGAQLGDLAESLFKRTTGVNEAGHLIPGHGGLLDRLDSLVFTIVLVYYFVRGVVL